MIEYEQEASEPRPSGPVLGDLEIGSWFVFADGDSVVYMVLGAFTSVLQPDPKVLAYQKAAVNLRTGTVFLGGKGAGVYPVVPTGVRSAGDDVKIRWRKVTA